LDLSIKSQDLEIERANNEKVILEGKEKDSSTLLNSVTEKKKN
jgi:hypothetical protein